MTSKLQQEITELKARAFDIRKQIEILSSAYDQVINIVNSKENTLQKEAIPKEETNEVQETKEESN